MKNLELWALAAVALGATAAAQTIASEQPSVGPVAPKTAPPIFNREMPAPTMVPVDLDDAVPAAGEALVQPGEHGDTLTSRANGDPFFLGFAAGRYYPPADERVDPELVAQALRAQVAGRGETFGFVMFGKRMTQARVEALQSFGVRVLEFHPHYCLKVALPVDALDAVAALDFVRWVGVARATQKLHPRLASLQPDADGRLALYVDVFESDLGPQSTSTDAAQAVRADGGVVTPAGDLGSAPQRWQSNGRQHLALAALGVEVLEYVESIRAFRVRALPAQLEALVAQDFVQFVEPDLPKRLGHDESTPMIGSDLTRNSYSGNSSGAISIGQADSGVDVGHWGLGIWGWGWDFSGMGTAWADGCEHGSHVMGTILGDGSGSYYASLKGVAPGLARSGGASRAYVARVFNNGCGWGGASLASIFAVFESSYWDGANWSNKPQLVSNSWGAGGIGWVGSEADARTVDNEVYNQDQLYLFCAGNDGSGASTIWLEATAKNAVAVGSVVDYYAPSGFPGAVSSFSSRGPCGDGRWKPNVMAPGEMVRSVDANSVSGYRDMQGTSMATPHVAGLAAQLTDAQAFLRYRPAGISAVLMSTAETKGNVNLSTPSDTHLDNYGTGRVEALKTIFGSSDYWWNSWVFNVSWPSGTYGDFSVPANCKRITVCMTYHEGAASAGASQALVSNWDMYLDDPYNGIDTVLNNGDWFAQQSTIDNTEIRSLDNPTVGTWRFKIYPQSVALFSTAKMSVCVTYEVNTNSCAPAHDVYTYSTYLQPNQQVDIYDWVSNSSGLASGVSLDQVDSGAVLAVSEGQLYDGPYTDHMGNQSGGRDVELGDIPPGWGRSQHWRASFPTEGNHSFGAYMDVDNYGWTYDAVNFVVDGTPPGLPSIGSTSHTSMVWSTDTSIDFAWATPADNLSGVQGYAIALFGGGIPLDPGNTMNFGAINAVTGYVGSSPTAYYLCMRPVDNCGNWTGGYAWSPPYLVDATAPSGPGAITSTTHTPGVQSCSTSVTINWSAATDADSGLAGYRGAWDTSASTIPSGALNFAAGATSQSIGLGSSTSPRYFHLRAQDNAGNWGTTQHFGPVLANAASVATYCTAKTNSLGCVPNVNWSGQPDKSAGTFTVTCTNVLNQQNGLLMWGTAQSATPFQGGWKCVANPVVRGPLIGSGGASTGNSCTGSYSHVFTTAYMNTWGIGVGQTIYAQFWMRDPASASTTGLSNAIRFTVCE